MAKRIIILDRSEGPPLSFNCLYWLAVPTGREVYYSRAGAVSAWKDASGPENAAIAAGTVVEVRDSASYPIGTLPDAVQANLEVRWTQKQADFTATQIPQRYGSFWDSITGWTLVNI